MQDITSGGAKQKTSGAIEGVKEKVSDFLGGDEDEEEAEEQPEERPRRSTSQTRKRSASSRSRS
jgi:hypothetical protein